jgi:hypothetical protein
MDNKEEVVEISGQKEIPVEVKQEPALPTEEQKPSEPTGELPKEVTERTKLEFEKLKAHNRDMADKLSKYESYGKNVFDSAYGQPAQTQTVPVPQVSQQPAPEFVDANGYVDTEALKRSFTDMSARTQRAEVEARKAQQIARQQEERRQVKEAHDRYPWLNPSNPDQFDPVGFELTRDRLVRNMVEGRDQTLAEVAEDVSKFHTPTVKADELKEQAVNEYKEKQVVKAQASAVQSGKGQPREEMGNLDDLRDRTRHGDQSALDERLKNI